MKLTILTLFPDMFRGPFDQSIIRRARDQKLADIQFVDIRQFAGDKYRSVDGHPYGGGVGMVLRVDVLDRVLSSVRTPDANVFLLDAAGPVFTQKKARELSALTHLILICGHYEGVDDRIRSLIDGELSIGEYVLTGGELPAMVIADSIIRLLPGVLRNEEATAGESFTDSTVEYPQYTEPREYKGMKVPDVLLGGNHARIAAWKNEQARERTKKRAQ